jgi:hypothetical protein
MKNMITLFGIIALAVVIGFSMAACKSDPDDSSDLDGTWIAEEVNAPDVTHRKIVAGGGYWTQYQSPDSQVNWVSVMEGTYPANAKSPVTATITRVNLLAGGGPDVWYNWSVLDPALQTAMAGPEYQLVIHDNQFYINGLDFYRQW